MYKALMFGAFSIVIAKVAYEQGRKSMVDDRHEYYYQGYEVGKLVGKLNEKYKEDESE